MSVDIGHITARLAEPSTDRVETLADLINQNINPPQELTTADVHIRVMYIASNQVNSFGGRFPEGELSRLVELLIDSPVMVGHRKDKLPVGRNFHAELTDREGKTWVKSYFYWLRSAHGAQDLKDNIDGGVYKECSIGFTFLLPECSVCGKDIRTCSHHPTRKYSVNGQDVTCHFNYRKLERVLETSLVYRGAVIDTSISRDLSRPGKSHQVNCSASLTRLTDLAALPPHCTYMVTPHYQGVELESSTRGGRLTLTTPDGHALPDAIAGMFDTTGVDLPDNYRAVMVGYRGKQRLPAASIQRLIDGRSASVTRLELKLHPDKDIRIDMAVQASSRHPIKVVKWKEASIDTIASVCESLSTKDGVRIHSLDSCGDSAVTYVYQPEDTVRESLDTYRFISHPDENDTYLMIHILGRTQAFRIKQCSLHRLCKGARFFCDEVDPTTVPHRTSFGHITYGPLISIEESSDGYAVTLDGPCGGVFNLKGVRINGKERFLIHLAPDQKTSPGSKTD